MNTICEKIKKGTAKLSIEIMGNDFGLMYGMAMLKNNNNAKILLTK